MATIPGWAKEFGREVIAGLVGEALGSLKKAINEQGAAFVGERIQRSVAERREEVMGFIQGDLRRRGGDYAIAAENLLKALQLRHNTEPRPYGGHEPYKPGDENHLANMLALLFGTKDPPPRPEQPDISKVKQPIATLMLEEYRRELRRRDRVARNRFKEKVELFKGIGLLPPEDLDALVEGVRDDGVYQMVVGRPVFEIKKAAKAPFKKIDDAAGKAAPLVGQMATWVDSLP